MQKRTNLKNKFVWEWIDFQSVGRTTVKECSLENDSHHPWVTVTSNPLLSHCFWTSAITVFHDFEYRTSAHQTKNRTMQFSFFSIGEILWTAHFWKNFGRKNFEFCLYIEWGIPYTLQLPTSGSACPLSQFDMQQWISFHPSFCMMEDGLIL